MRRIDLTRATMEGWVRLDKLELRAWLLRRLKNPRFATFDPACLTFGDADIALMMRAAGKAPGEAAREGQWQPAGKRSRP